MSKEVLAALRERFGDAVLTPIRIDARMKQASSARQTIFEFSRRSRAGEDYRQVCRELFA
jgi:cellulose biosynthesis protein BcsQ